MLWLRRFPLCLLSCLLVLSAWGAEFKLITGDVYRGELSAADQDGIVVRQETGDFSPRIDWAKLSDETLRVLATNPRAKRFAEPLVEPAVEAAPAPAKEISVRPVASRVVLPETQKGLGAALTSINGILLLVALYAANLYAAFEVARFKWRSVPLVCGISLILPVVGWLIFLMLPRQVQAEVENATEAALAQTSLTATPASAPAPAATAARSGAAAALGLSKTAGGAGGNADGLPKVFRRGETTFNRRFFETQFPSFFRVVASEADKDLVIDVAAGKSSVVATRISRISANEVHMKTATNQEVAVGFNDVTQVTLRHKDAA